MALELSAGQFLVLGLLVLAAFVLLLSGSPD